ncbi:hypothetical protein FOCC_FOCC001501 [Frankliniella occidentalis]|nr:hypothetical protein FOCC_FOCC001501 [Frankliniella occidentalis]
MAVVVRGRKAHQQGTAVRLLASLPRELHHLKKSEITLLEKSGKKTTNKSSRTALTTELLSVRLTGLRGTDGRVQRGRVPEGGAVCQAEAEAARAGRQQEEEREPRAQGELHAVQQVPHQADGQVVLADQPGDHGRRARPTVRRPQALVYHGGARPPAEGQVAVHVGDQPAAGRSIAQPVAAEPLAEPAGPGAPGLQEPCHSAARQRAARRRLPPAGLLAAAQLVPQLVGEPVRGRAARGAVPVPVVVRVRTAPARRQDRVARPRPRRAAAPRLPRALRPRPAPARAPLRPAAGPPARPRRPAPGAVRRLAPRRRKHPMV